MAVNTQYVALKVREPFADGWSYNCIYTIARKAEAFAECRHLLATGAAVAAKVVHVSDNVIASYRFYGNHVIGETAPATRRAYFRR